jgi:4-hydroxy-4-methyl-2-oxoglutarate aldolase
VVAATAADLLALGAATLGECGGMPMQPRVRAAWPGARLAAPALTVRCAPGDNLALHAAVVDAPAGWALVAQVAGARARGYWGEVLTVAAQARGLAGVVVDAGVRDVAALARRGFPVFSACVALAGTSKAGPGEVGGTVSVGDVDVEPGDWVVGDDDGVVVVPAAMLADVTAAARRRAERERALFDALGSGRTTVELLGLDLSRVRRRSDPR